MFYIQFFLLKKWANRSFPLFLWAMWVNRSGRSPKNERCERIAQVTHQKWATMSNSLRSLRGNERSWANRSGRSPKMSKWVNCSFFGANRSFANFWAKTDERIPSPDFYTCTVSLAYSTLIFFFYSYSTTVYSTVFTVYNCIFKLQ